MSPKSPISVLAQPNSSDNSPEPTDTLGLGNSTLLGILFLLLVTIVVGASVVIMRVGETPDSEYQTSAVESNSRSGRIVTTSDGSTYNHPPEMSSTPDLSEYESAFQTPTYDYPSNDYESVNPYGSNSNSSALEAIENAQRALANISKLSTPDSPSSKTFDLDNFVFLVQDTGGNRFSYDETDIERRGSRVFFWIQVSSGRGSDRSDTFSSTKLDCSSGNLQVLRSVDSNGVETALGGGWTGNFELSRALRNRLCGVDTLQ